MEKKVSIITPCYNGEKFLARYLNSILAQSYKNLELILVNDGSTDGTEEVIKFYEKKFIKNNIAFVYINKKNEGPASALNEGLKHFSGEFLIWPDSDDFLTKDSIEKRVSFLEKNPQYDMVRSDAYIVDEKNINIPVGFVSDKFPSRFKEKIFEDLFNEKTFVCPGCYMIRTEKFLAINPKREIYVYPGIGQNWQLLMPMSYAYKCGFIDEPLYNYVVRSDSHCHGDENIDLETYLNKFALHEKVLRSVIESIPVDINLYNNLITEKYVRRRLEFALRYKDKNLLKKEYKNLKNSGTSNVYDKINLIRGNFYFFDLAYRVLRKLKRFFSLNLQRGVLR